MEILDIPGSEPGAWRKPEEILENGYQISIGDAISEGFDIFKEQVGSFVGYTVVMLIISGIASYISTRIPFVQLLVGGPLAAGFFVMAHQIKTNGDTDFGLFFKGFEKFLPLFLYTLVSSIFIVIGTFLLLIPGIYLGVAYSLGVPFVLFYKLEFWDAMEFCRKIITREWWSFLGLIIVVFFINLGGLLAFGIGILFTIPISYCAIYAAFRQVAAARDSEPAAEEAL